MVTLRAAISPAFWLGSLCAHAAALVAVVHPALPPRAMRSPREDVTIDVVRDFDPAPVVPEPIPAGTSSRSIVALHAATRTALADAEPDTHPSNSAPRLPPAASAASRDSLAVVVTPEPARFVMTVANARAGESRASPATGPDAAHDLDGAPGTDGAPLPEEVASSPARLVSMPSPVYPPQARAQEIEADVVLAIVVTSHGDVTDARILQSAGFGLDESALLAVREARFAPALREGRRVAVRRRWTVSFRLR